MSEINTIKRGKNKVERNWLFTVIFIVLVLYIVVLAIPFLWALLNAFKTPDEFHGTFLIKKNPLGWPKKGFTFDNFKYLFNDEVFFGTNRGLMNNLEHPDELSGRIGIIGRMGSDGMYHPGLLTNSILYAVGCAIAATLTPCFTAYAVAKFDFKFSKVIYTVVIVVMALPIVGSLPSEIKVATDLGIIDTMLGMWIMKANFLGLYFLVFHAQFKSISNTYSEAARVDGASNFRIMFQIILPFAFGTMITVFLLTFIMFWNDYQTPMNYLHNNPVLAQGMINFYRSTSNEFKVVQKTPVKLAVILLAASPIILLALLSSKKLTQNLSVGGVKE